MKTLTHINQALYTHKRAIFIHSGLIIYKPFGCYGSSYGPGVICPEAFCSTPNIATSSLWPNSAAIIMVMKPLAEMIAF